MDHQSNLPKDQLIQPSLNSLLNEFNIIMEGSVRVDK